MPALRHRLAANGDGWQRSHVGPGKPGAADMDGLRLFKLWRSRHGRRAPRGAAVIPPGGELPVAHLYPDAKSAHEDLPERARAYLDQAYETMHAPDACAVMCGSAVDAMLKELGLSKGSVYDRINEAVAKNQLTKSMGEWAHEVRLGSNRPRHADTEKPHVTPEEARQSVEYTEALGNVLFVLSARVARGLEEAKKVQVEGTS